MLLSINLLPMPMISSRNHLSKHLINIQIWELSLQNSTNLLLTVQRINLYSYKLPLFHNNNHSISNNSSNYNNQMNNLVEDILLLININNNNSNNNYNNNKIHSIINIINHNITSPVLLINLYLWRLKIVKLREELLKMNSHRRESREETLRKLLKIRNMKFLIWNNSNVMCNSLKMNSPQRRRQQTSIVMRLNKNKRHLIVSLMNYMLHRVIVLV